MSPCHPGAQPIAHTPVTMLHDCQVKQCPQAKEQFGPQVVIGHSTIYNRYRMFIIYDLITRRKLKSGFFSSEYI